APGRAAAPATVVAVPARDAGAGPAGTTDGQRGWALAHWAVARAGALRIDRVAYAGRVWSAGDAGAGWQHAPKRSGESDKSRDSEVRITLAQ
ncbi:hypothetical protein L1885_28625, partial [Streptomyces fuscigenes]|nr:hypothetical protein [Streptomyces fuscigenes]